MLITLLKKSLCAFRRDKYALSEPKSVTKDAYMKDLKNSLLVNPEVGGTLFPASVTREIGVKIVWGYTRVNAHVLLGGNPSKKSCKDLLVRRYGKIWGYARWDIPFKILLIILHDLV